MAETYLHVEQIDSGLAISADVVGDAFFKVEIVPGEVFGGRIFEEWQALAREHVSVPADWLKV